VKVLRMMLAVLGAAAAIGMLAFLIFMTQSVDPELHQARLERLRQINNLDVQLNRTLVEARFTSIALAGDERGRIADQLGTLLEAIGGRAAEPELDAEGNPIPAPPVVHPESLQDLNPAVTTALEAFVQTIEDKVVLAFDFEARNTTANLRLINSMDAVPRAADATLALAAAANREHLAELMTQLKSEALSFAVTPTPTNEPAIRALLDEINAIGAGQSEAFRGSAATLGNSIGEVLADKKELIDRLNGFLGRPTGPLLQQLEAAYLSWHEGEIEKANQWRLYLAGYAAALLLTLALVGLRLARSYRDLDRANAGLSHANEHLEEQVQTRTKDLSTALTDLRASQAQLVQSEKMASLGTMVAGVAHEINTPLGYVRSNTDIVRKSLGEIRSLCATQAQALRLLATEGSSEDEIARSMSAAQALGESLNADELASDLDGLLGDADHGLKTIAELVAGLKDFSRVDRSRNDLFNVNDGIESALKIAHNQLKHRVGVVRSYGKLPQIECAPSQLNQVFLNLFTNAAQAIEGNGKIYVHTAANAEGVIIRVMDTGCGMSEDVRKRVFEPFFTTKPVGKGTGLGLSIVYNIVTEHGGRIEVKSTTGKGSEFIINLPLKQRRSAATEAAVAEPALAAA
jgi:two-component system NtrC family sensor kinase